MENAPIDIYPEHRALFRLGLQGIGIRAVAAEGTVERFEGEISVPWEDPGGSGAQTTVHRIRVELPEAFPFAKPAVLPLDTDPPISYERHQAPAENGAFCLYSEEENGWVPWTTAEELAERIREWLVHYHQNDWPANDRPPDLHLYFPGDGMRRMMLVGEEWHLPPDTDSGRFAFWHPKATCAFAANPAPGSRSPSARSGDRILSFLGMAGMPSAHVGLWFRLNREPAPAPTLDGMLASIDQAAEKTSGWSLSHLRALVGYKVSRAGARVLLALGYPDESGGTRWLFLYAAVPGSQHGPQKLAKCLPDSKVGSYEAAGVDHASLMRRTGHTEHRLKDKSVLVFGLGSIGSAVAVLLAKAGIGRLHLVDSDRLRPGNAVRHAAGLDLVGEAKTLATEFEVRRHAPDCAVRLSGAIWDPVILGGWLDADVVIDATANVTFSLLLNELCLRQRKTVVYVAAYRRAVIGRVRLVRPGQDACMVCYEAGEGGYLDSADYPAIPFGEEGEFVEGGCGNPTVEASAADVEASANFAARTALRFLEGKQGDENHCLIVNEVLPEAIGPFATLGAHWQRWMPIAGCGGCGAVERLR